MKIVVNIKAQDYYYELKNAVEMRPKTRLKIKNLLLQRMTDLSPEKIIEILEGAHIRSFTSKEKEYNFKELEVLDLKDFKYPKILHLKVKVLNKIYFFTINNREVLRPEVKEYIIEYLEGKLNDYTVTDVQNINLAKFTKLDYYSVLKYEIKYSGINWITLTIPKQKIYTK